MAHPDTLAVSLATDAPASTGGAPDRWIAHSDAAGLAEPERNARNAAFERAELTRCAAFFDRALPQPLNHEQRAAIVVDEDATLVVASAGSGKTTLLLGKIAYLVMRGRARPQEIALLAFNNSVRAEIRERLSAQHPQVAVHTFHSLGLELIARAQQPAAAPRLSPLVEDPPMLAFVSDHLLHLAGCASQALADWLTTWPHPLRDATDFGSAREFAGWQRCHAPVTLRGERVDRTSVREVADRLTAAGIAYRLGVALPTLPGLPPSTAGVLLPDARLLLVVEDGDISTGAIRRPRSRWARGVDVALTRIACWRQRLVPVTLRRAGQQQREGRLGDHLAAVLGRHGLDLAPRALPRLLAAPDAAMAARRDVLARLLAAAIGLQRGRLSPGPPTTAVPPGDPRDTRRAAVFDGLLGPLLEAYAAHLAAHGEVDFNDMIVRAAQALEAGRVTVPFRYLLVDEFQDISAGRADLVKALRRARPGMRLVAVGDDWQSIYRFAGSDVSIMTRFAAHFGHTETRFLRQTFRFDRRIEQLASTFVLRNPAQIRKQVDARDPDSADPSVVLWWPEDGAEDDPMPAIAADLLGPVVQEPVAGGAAPAEIAGAARPEVLVLGRYRSQEALARLDRLRLQYPQVCWRFSTMHRAKGATADYAVVLGVSGGRRAFPATRGDDPLLGRFLGAPEDYPHAEERRLFYVALTRARWRVYVVGSHRRPSPFFVELQQIGGNVVQRGAVRATDGFVCA